METGIARHPLDALIPDPSGMPPLGDEAEFAAKLQLMVAGAAPRVFAVVQEFGERVDAHIAGWGLAFGERHYATSVSGGLTVSAAPREHVLRLFGRGTRISARLVWVSP